MGFMRYRRKYSRRCSNNLSRKAGKLLSQFRSEEGRSFNCECDRAFLLLKGLFHLVGLVCVHDDNNDDNKLAAGTLRLLIFSSLA